MSGQTMCLINGEAKYCEFCKRPIHGWCRTPSTKENPLRAYHIYQDEVGHATPKEKGSCWELSNHGTRNVAEFYAECLLHTAREPETQPST